MYIRQFNPREGNYEEEEEVTDDMILADCDNSEIVNVEDYAYPDDISKLGKATNGEEFAACLVG